MSEKQYENVVTMGTNFTHLLPRRYKTRRPHAVSVSGTQTHPAITDTATETATATEIKTATQTETATQTQTDTETGTETGRHAAIWVRIYGADSANTDVCAVLWGLVIFTTVILGARCADRERDRERQQEGERDRESGRESDRESDRERERESHIATGVTTATGITADGGGGERGVQMGVEGDDVGNRAEVPPSPSQELAIAHAVLFGIVASSSLATSLFFHKVRGRVQE